MILLSCRRRVLSDGESTGNIGILPSLEVRPSHNALSRTEQQKRNRGDMRNLAAHEQADPGAGNAQFIRNIGSGQDRIVRGELVRFTVIRGGWSLLFHGTLSDGELPHFASRNLRETNQA